MKALTQEERQALITRCQKISTWRDKYGDSANVMLPADEAEQLANIALTALTAEPVAYTAQDNIDGFGRSVGYMWPPGNEKPSDIALYKFTPVAALPEGWKLVPVEPTPEMLRAAQLRSELGSYATSRLAGGYSLIDEMYEKMVSAAPEFNGDTTK